MYIKTDKLDRFMYKDTRAANPGIPALEDKGSPKLPIWPEAVKDLWSGLFKSKPEFDQEASGSLATAMKDVMETKEWQNLRHHTKLDELGSAIGTVTFGNQFYDNLPPEVLEAQKAQDEVKNLEELLSQPEAEQSLSGENNAQSPAGNGNPDPNQTPQVGQGQPTSQPGQGVGTQNGMSPAIRQRLSSQLVVKKLAAANAMKKAERACGGDINQAIRIAARKAAEEAKDETSKMKSLISTWGDTAGEGGKVPTLKDQLALSAKIKKNKKFGKIVEMVGRMKRIAEGIQAKKVNRVPEEIVDVELGRDLSSVLPSQFSLLNNKTTKLEFYRQYEERSLLQYKKTGTEKVGKGPIIVMVDESGSMEGDRIIWAKAIGLALSHIAKKQKRTIWLCGFSSKGQVWSKKFEKGVIKSSELDTYINQFYAGGTDYDAALNKCAALIKEDKKEKADVIFISDGECELSSRAKSNFNKLKKEMAFRVFGIGIGVEADSFKDFCDASYSIGDLNADEICLEGVFGV